LIPLSAEQYQKQNSNSSLCDGRLEEEISLNVLGSMSLGLVEFVLRPTVCSAMVGSWSDALVSLLAERFVVLLLTVGLVSFALVLPECSATVGSLSGALVSRSALGMTVVFV